MVKVLVIGAAGYVGFGVACALRRSGNVVYGLVRKADQQALLTRNEIFPICGEISELSKLESLLGEVSVVVDTVQVHGPDVAAPNRALLNKLKQLAQQTHTKKRYIYTSGCLTYGDHGGQVVDETCEARGFAWRAAYEQEVIANRGPNLDGAVIRPGWVFGYSFGRYAPWFELADPSAPIVIHGKPDKYISTIHLDDLSDAYVRLVEGASGLVAGEIFDCADDSRLTYEQLRVAFARAAGSKGVVQYAPALSDPFSQASEASVILRTDKIRRVLGWQPRHGPLVDNLPQAFQAWKAYKTKLFV